MAISSNASNALYKDCIDNNIPSRAFRYATESKNVLSTAGAMYVGTGLKRKTTMLLDAPDWVSGTSYAAGSIVTYSGKNYKAKAAMSGSTPPSSDTSNWEDVSVGYDSFVTAVLRTPFQTSGAVLQTRLVFLAYENSNETVYRDANFYLTSSDTAGATIASGYFPCWCSSSSPTAGILSIPKVIG